VFLSVLTGLPMLWGRTTGLVYWRIRIGQRLNPWLVFLAVASLLVVVFLRF